MMVAVGHWYASDPFWAAVGAMIGLAGVAATVWVARTPRQRLSYGMPVATRLLTTPSGMADLELHHRGTLLTEPYLVEVRLTSRGRRDIPSSAFDRDRPLVFDLGVRIVEVLQIVCDPPSAPTPPVTQDGSTLEVGPELIGRRQTITISVLTDGGCPRLSCTRNTLTQVTVTQRQPDEGPVFVLIGAVIVFGTMGVVAATVAALVKHKSDSDSLSALLFLLMVSVGMASASWFSRNRRER